MIENHQKSKMKAIIFLLAAAFVFMFGCSKAEEETSRAVHIKRDAAGKEEENRAPYYYGLIEEYKTNIAQDPDNLAAVIALGNAYYDSGRWKEAVTYYSRALSMDPRNANIRTDMGTAYRNMGLHKRALAEYQKALEHDPDHQNARYNMGVVYAYDMQNYPVAIRIWEDLLRTSPNHPRSEQMRSSIMTFKKAVKKEKK